MRTALAFFIYTKGDFMDIKQTNLKLNSFLDEIREDEPGAILMAEFDNGQSFLAKKGLANVNDGIEIDENSVFDLASVSKQFTATCLYILQSRNQLSVEDYLREHLPELPDYTQEIKIINLINHTSGIPDYINIATDLGIEFTDYLDNEKTLKILSEKKSPEFQPGSKFSYSNSNYLLLSLIVERVSGKPISRFANDNIFSPLGMNKTFYNECYPLLTPTVQGYYRESSEKNYLPTQCIWTQTGDGAVFSSVSDLIKWGRNLSLNTKLPSDVVENLLTPMPEKFLDKLVENYTPYSAGLSVQEDFDQKSALHSGGWIGFCAFFVRHLESGLTLAVLSNREDYNPGYVAYRASELLLNKHLGLYEQQKDLGY